MAIRWRFVAVAVGVAVLLFGCARPAASPGPRPIAQASPTGETDIPTPVTPPITEASPTTTAPPLPVIGLLTITSAVFHVGEVGIAYSSVALSASGGVPPFRWTSSVGSLPGGLSLSSGGVVSGTPTAAGGFSFTVRVADTVGDSAIVNRSITVLRYMVVSGNCTGLCMVEQGCVTVCGGYASIGGGVTPYSYALAGGALPPGTNLAAPSFGSLGGTFTTVSGAAPFSFAVTITDAFGASATVKANFRVFPHIAFTVTTALCTPTTAPLTCTTSQLQYRGGTPGGTPIVKVTNVNSPTKQLPPGFTAYAKGGTVVVTVPTQKTSYGGDVTLILIDQSPCSPQGNCQSNVATVTIKV